MNEEDILQTMTIWEKLRETHFSLLELTYEEFSLLKRCDFKNIIKLTQKKKQLLQTIKDIDKERSSFVKQLSKKGFVVDNVHDLSELIQNSNSSKNYNLFVKINQSLKKVILDLQKQNSLNSKLMFSLQENIEGLLSHHHKPREYKSYGKKGQKVSHFNVT